MYIIIIASIGLLHLKAKLQQHKVEYWTFSFTQAINALYQCGGY